MSSSSYTKFNFLKTGDVVGTNTGILNLEKYNQYVKRINYLFNKNKDDKNLSLHKNIITAIDDSVKEKLKNGYILGIGLQDNGEISVDLKKYVDELNVSNSVSYNIGELFLYNKNTNELLIASPENKLQFINNITLGSPEDDINVVKNEIKKIL